MKAYASGLDYHLSDDQFQSLFAYAASIGYRAFKIKVGHPDFDRDLHRLKLLEAVIPAGSEIMIDANEAWSAKEALMKIERIRRRPRPALGRRSHSAQRFRRPPAVAPVCLAHPDHTGEYLDLTGKRLLLEAEAADMINVHGQVGDVMKIGWLAAEKAVPVSLGNTFLEVGVHMACALPEVEWLEYSFQNFDHLVDEPVRIENGWAYAPERPGHGLVLSETARRDWARPTLLARQDLGPRRSIPDCRFECIDVKPAREARHHPWEELDMLKTMKALLMGASLAAIAGQALSAELTVWDWKSGDPPLQVITRRPRNCSRPSIRM